MSERAAQIAARLAEQGAETVGFFKSLSPRQWTIPVYAGPPVWTPRHLLAHFLSAERTYLDMIGEVLKGGQGMPEGFDIDTFNAGEVAALESLAPEELLAQFEAARAGVIALVQSMSDADLDREARHPFMGWDRVEKFLKLIYRHTMIHQRDMRRVLD
jgi:hypothetical protein